MNSLQLYQPRQPRRSPLWRCVRDHGRAFLTDYDRHHHARDGPLRPVVGEVLEKFTRCGDLHRGFARVRCPHCQLEYLLAFSCKTRGFCPSCQQRRTVETAQFLVTDVLAIVPHRHYVFSLPVALRGFFQRDRSLLKVLCRLANESLVEYFRNALDRADGAPGVVLTLHTFGDFLNFHPHIHAVVSDGLFDRSGAYHPVEEHRLRALREIFQAKVYRVLVQQKLLSPALVHRFLQWKHSGFNLFRGEAVVGTHRAELENLAQYILRHSFSVEKMTYLPQNGRVVYHSRMNQTTRRNFEVFTAVDFLAAVTRHIPDKGAQIVKYYGWYSNKARGQRARNAVGRAGPPGPPSSAESAVADPQSKIRKKIPSRTWRELIKKIWNTDPLLCPKCGGEMRLISLIEDRQVIEDILRHLSLWEEKDGPSGLAPPEPPFRLELTYAPVDDQPYCPDESFAE